jgi:hypothetical protein
MSAKQGQNFHWGAVLLGLLAAAGCPDCDDDAFVQLPDPEDQIDVFEQKGAAKVDILWVVDDSESMAQEQEKVSNGFSAFFQQLLDSQVDYQIGVVTTNPAGAGILRAYDGPTVEGCSGCRFLTNEVGCDDPNTLVAGLSESDIVDLLADKCHAQLVFRNLIAAGISNYAFEEGFTQAAIALGIEHIDPDTGDPDGVIPLENADFIREDASLYIIFVSDEDEGDKAEGFPIRYYQRLFEGVKERGDESKVSVSAIAGWPQSDEYPGIDELCDILETTYDGNLTTDDPQAATVRDVMNDRPYCIDAPENDEDDVLTRAEAGGRYIELACRTGGVVTNICDDEYSVALDSLGANAAGLLRKFTLSKFERMEAGEDCTLFTSDDIKMDCNEDGDEDDSIDSAICVKATPLGGGDQVYLVQRSEASGWSLETSTGAIRFRGQFIPAPGSQVEISYRLQVESSRCGAPE